MTRSMLVTATAAALALSVSLASAQGVGIGSGKDNNPNNNTNTNAPDAVKGKRNPAAINLDSKASMKLNTDVKENNDAGDKEQQKPVR